MALSTEEKVINHLREIKAILPRQKSIADIAEAISSDIYNVQLATRRLRDSGRVVVSSRHLNEMQPASPPAGNGLEVKASAIKEALDKHRQERIGPILVSLGESEAEKLKKEEQDIEDREAERQHRENVRILAEQAKAAAERPAGIHVGGDVHGVLNTGAMGHTINAPGGKRVAQRTETNAANPASTPKPKSSWLGDFWTNLAVALIVLALSLLIKWLATGTIV